MPHQHKYRIYCHTENTWVSGWSASQPTTCFNNAGHAVNIRSWQKIADSSIKHSFNTGGGDTVTTLTLPDADDTLVALTANQTLTNKTINAILNHISNIADTNIKSGAAIDASKIADGSVSNTEFQYLNGLTDNIQTQIANHSNNTENPHAVTKVQVGLSNVQNLKINLTATTDPTANDDAGDGYQIGSRWINTVTAKEYVCVYDAATAAIWKETTSTGSSISGGATGAFGSLYHYAESLPESSTTSSNYVRKLRLTTDSLPTGDYRISWAYTWNHDNSSGSFRAQVQVDDATTIFTHFQEPKDPGVDQGHSVSSFAKISLSAGVHDIDLDWSRNGTGTAKIKNARLELWRVS